MIKLGGCGHKTAFGNSAWKETGNDIAEGREYICSMCGLKHLATEQEVAMGKFFPEPLLKPLEAMTIDRMETMGKAFEIFAEDKPDVFQKVIKKGTLSSCAIWVPKRYRDCPVTVIIWKNGREYLE